MPGGMQAAIGLLPCPPAAWFARLSSRTFWYSGVSGACWLRPAGLPGSKVPALFLTHWPFQSGNCALSAWAPAIAAASAHARASAPIECRQAMTVLHTVPHRVALFCHDFHFIARLDPVARRQAVEHAEAVDRPIMDRHAGGQPLYRIVLTDGDHAETQRFGGARFRQAHAAEAHNRVVEGLVDLRRHPLGCKDEAINVGAEAHGVDAEGPLLAPGDRSRRCEAVDAEILDVLRIDAFDPAGGQIFGQPLIGGNAHDVEPQGLAAAFLDAQNRLRGVVEDEALRRHEGEAELGMEETAAAREAFAWILAVDKAVDGGEIGFPIAFAAARCGELACVALRIAHALGCGGMRGQEFDRPRVELHPRVWLEVRVAPHRGEEAHGAVGIVPGTRGDADADAVRLEFLGA